MPARNGQAYAERRKVYSMNSCKKLREICDDLGVSRRAVQGYEKAGLVCASDKNKYGHLLYDEKTQKRIAQIKLYQQFGFSIKEIKEIIDAPNYVIKAALERQLLQMDEERERLEGLIEKIYELIEEIGV